MKLKQPTTTFLVENVLAKLDDFVHLHDLMILTGRNVCQVSAALHHLKLHKHADNVGQEWFLLQTDDRCRIIEEQYPETRPRKQRRKRVKELA